MPAKKRTYYRNWYQETLGSDYRKSGHKEYDSTTYRSPSLVSTVDPTQYKANHTLRPNTTPYSPYAHKAYTPPKREGTMELSLGSETPGSDILRGIMLGIPLLCAIFVMLYSFGLLPSQSAQPTLAMNTELNTYVTQYEELITLHNTVNTTVRDHLKSEDFSSLYKSELGKTQAQIQEKTTQLATTNAEPYSNMNRLLKLKLTSLTQMIEAFIAAEMMTEELTATYEEFVMTQNELATQITASLTKVFDDQEIKYEKQVGGGIKVY